MEVRIGRRISRGMLPLLALHTFGEYYRSERKPPVTAALIAANTLIYIRPSFLDSLIPSIDEVWFNPHLILKHKDIKRFFLSAFYHMGEPHLVYNMISLLWKGIQLETAMGSVEFASMMASLLALSQGITLLLSKSLLVLFDYQKSYYYEYAVGFSGILFAMKVVLNSQLHDYTNVYGVTVPSRYAVWAELILIQMFVPGVSFLGHLGGILAGLVYLKLKRSYSGLNPSNFLIRGFNSVLNWPFSFLHNFFGFQRGRISGRRIGGGGGNDNRRGGGGDVWRCETCTYDNSSLMTVCEMCGTSRGEIDTNISLNELRLRRIQRFIR